MKQLVQLYILISLCTPCFTQYYIRGEIVNDKGKLIPNASLYMASKRMIFDGGSSGTFGLMSSCKVVDTITVKAEGYETLRTPIYVATYNKIKLQTLGSIITQQKNRLASLTKGYKSTKLQNIFLSNETYSNLIENDFVTASTYPQTTFAVNCDKASYSNVRRFINTGSRIPTNAVRINEMVNYFNLTNPLLTPPTTSVFTAFSQLSYAPWQPANLLLYIHLQAQKLNLSNLPASNLVFLIDNSGSMELQNRMPLLKSAFKLLINNLRSNDTVSIVTYGGNVNVALHPISGYYKDSITKTIEAMEAAGDTPGESAIRIAYNLAKKNYITNGNNRVILATDGDFNVGIADEKELEKLIILQSQSGIYLTCLGIGMGNYKDSKLAILAQKGHGNFCYIDTEAEAEKVLVKELTQTLYSVADNTTFNLKCNAQYVQSYRLLGYDNKLDALTDTTSRIDGGDVGSGYNTIVIIEIKPTALLMQDSAQLKNIANLVITYDNPKNKAKESYTYTCNVSPMPLAQLHTIYQFSTAVAMLGGYIKQSDSMQSITLTQIAQLATNCISSNSSNLQQEFVQLVLKAQKVYENGKIKKRKQ